MALTERLRVAMERKRRAAALPAYLERLRVETGVALTQADLLDDQARDALREERRPGEAARAERRTIGLSAGEADQLTAWLRRHVADSVVLVGFGQDAPALARIPLHEVLVLATRATPQWGDLFVASETGDSDLFMDLLLPGDYGNRHPEGSCELVLRGPLFDGVELPERFTAAPYSA